MLQNCFHRLHSYFLTPPDATPAPDCLVAVANKNRPPTSIVVSSSFSLYLTMSFCIHSKPDQKPILSPSSQTLSMFGSIVLNGTFEQISFIDT